MNITKKSRYVYIRLVSMIVLITVALGLFMGDFMKVKALELSGMTQRMLVNYEQCAGISDYVSNFEGNGASYISEDSNLRIVTGSASVSGYRTLMAKNFDMRWWSIGAQDLNMTFTITVKMDENFYNTLSVMINTQDTVTTTEGLGGRMLKISRLDRDIVVYNAENEIIAALEENTTYLIRIDMTRGKSDYNVTINGKKTTGENTFVSNIYAISGLRLYLTEDTPKDEIKPETTALPEATPNISATPTPVPTMAPKKDHYIYIDDIGIYTKGRTYSQRYSSQSTGNVPMVILPEYSETTDIQVYVNSTKIAMPTAPVVRDGVLYIPAEHLFKCLKISYVYSTSDGSIKLNNDGLTVNAVKNSYDMTVNGTQVKLAYPPRIIDGVMMVTPNFLNETLNVKVWYDKNASTVVLTSGTMKNDGVLRIIGGKFYMNGEPYYEISFNKFDLFYQIIADYVYDRQFPSQEYTYSAARAAIEQLHNDGFSSVRVFCISEAYPDILYNEEHKALYFEAMDKMFALCNEYGIKVVVCLSLLSDLFIAKEYVENYGWINKETINEIVYDAESESRENVYEYISAMVSRYKDNDAILMWEIQNEANLGADIGNQVLNVSYSISQLGKFYTDCVRYIKKIDDSRLVTSGDSILRPAQWHLFQAVMNGASECDWKVDTKEERLNALWTINSGVDVISVHGYGVGRDNSDSKFTNENGTISLFRYDHLMYEARRLGKVLYNGETAGSMDETESGYIDINKACLEDIIDGGVQITHWWTFRSDRQGFNDGNAWRLDKGELLEAIKSANRQLKLRYVVNEADNENTNVVWNNSDTEVFDYSDITDGQEYIIKKNVRKRVVRFLSLTLIMLLASSCLMFILLNNKKKSVYKKSRRAKGR